MPHWGSRKTNCPPPCGVKLAFLHPDHMTSTTHVLPHPGVLLHFPLHTTPTNGNPPAGGQKAMFIQPAQASGRAPTTGPFRHRGLIKTPVLWPRATTLQGGVETQGSQRRGQQPVTKLKHTQRRKGRTNARKAFAGTNPIRVRPALCSKRISVPTVPQKDL